MTNSSFQAQASVKKEPSDSSPYSSSDESTRNESDAKRERIEETCKEDLLPDVKSSVKREEIKSERKRKRVRDSKRKKPKCEPDYERDVENVYFEDKHRDKGNNNVNVLCSRARPLYDSSEKILGFSKHKRSRKDTFRRYFVKNIDCAETSRKKDTIIKRTNEKGAAEKEETNETSYPWCRNVDEEQKSKTREYNERLTRNPRDVELWLEYIDFQVPSGNCSLKLISSNDLFVQS